MSKDELEALEAKVMAAREARSRAMVVEADIYSTLLECIDKGADLRALEAGLRENLQLVVGIIYEKGENSAQGTEPWPTNQGS